MVTIPFSASAPVPETEALLPERRMEAEAFRVSAEEETEAADGSEIPDEAEPERELTEIQGICLTVSLVFILAAVISVIAKKKA